MRTAGLSTFVVLIAYLAGYASALLWGPTAVGLLIGLSFLCALLIVGYGADYLAGK